VVIDPWMKHFSLSTSTSTLLTQSISNKKREEIETRSLLFSSLISGSPTEKIREKETSATSLERKKEREQVEEKHE